MPLTNARYSVSDDDDPRLIHSGNDDDDAGGFQKDPDDVTQAFRVEVMSSGLFQQAESMARRLSPSAVDFLVRLSGTSVESSLSSAMLIVDHDVWNDDEEDDVEDKGRELTSRSRSRTGRDENSSQSTTGPVWWSRRRGSDGYGGGSSRW